MVIFCNHARLPVVVPGCNGLSYWLKGSHGYPQTTQAHDRRESCFSKKMISEIKLVAAQSFYPAFQSLWCRKVLCTPLKEKPGCQASHRILHLQCVFPEKCEVAVVVPNL